MTGSDSVSVEAKHKETSSSGVGSTGHLYRRTPKQMFLVSGRGQGNLVSPRLFTITGRSKLVAADLPLLDDQAPAGTWSDQCSTIAKGLRDGFSKSRFAVDHGQGVNWF